MYIYIFIHLIKIFSHPVQWVYEVWDATLIFGLMRITYLSDVLKFQQTTH